MYKTALIIGLLACFLCAMLGNSDLLRRFEHIGYDLSVYLSLDRPISDDIVIIAIDDAAIEQYGPWPWTRNILAAAQRRIDKANPSVVAYTLSFEAAHNERGLEIMGAFRNKNASLMGRKLINRFQQAVNRLDSDHTLAVSFRNTKSVLLGLQYQPGISTSDTPTTLRKHLLSSADQFAGKFSGWPSLFIPDYDSSAARFYLPTRKIGDAADGWAAGSDYLSGVDGSRAVPLIINIGDLYMPSLSILISAALQNLDVKGIKLIHGKGIKVGQNLISTNQAGYVYPYFYSGDNDTGAFPTYSITDVLNDKVPTSEFTGKAVLVGLTADRFTQLHSTPIGQDMAPVELLAHSVSSLVEGDLYRPTGWSYALRYAGLVLVAIYLMIVLPRLSPGTGLAVSALFAVLLLNIELILMLTQAVWAPMMLCIAALIIGQALIEINRTMYARVHKYKAALTESNLQLARTLQAQGQLDPAFAKYKACVTNNDVLYGLYTLGEDFERKRQFKKASDVFRYITNHQRKYRDAEKRIKKNEQLDSAVVLGGDSRHSSTQTLILTDNGVKKPVLGRYEIEKEIGRGEMGAVYLGKDPKIGRTVAIKTMSFSQEFDAEVSDDVKQRFQREASAAGRLNHPNIVTVYDVGEEQELSYIAMDYLEGKPLSAFTKRKKLLPVETVLEIMAQVADALHYAHGKKVVHRDIKPENIIYNEDSGKPTLTDFGVACITDATKTKTGVVLGSPSYMSPEQLSGKRLNGQSDLFSLGVTLFQLLAGELPFKSESLSSLMYKIANNKHPDIRKLRDDIPSCVSTIINKALQKDPAKRYDDGKQMSSALTRCKNKYLEEKG